jgi:hypothetical protein
VNGEGRPGGNATKTADQLAKAKTEFIARSDVPSQICRRREASRRLPVQTSGRADPLYYEPPGVSGYEDAAVHLLSLGLTPAPDLPALQAMWKAGAETRSAAQVVARRWGLVA